MLGIENMVEEMQLSETDQKMVDDFSQKIDLKDAAFILQYGTASQKKVAAFSDSALEKACSKALDGTNEMLTDLVEELKEFSAAEETKGGFFGFFKKAGDKIAWMKERYSRVEENIDRITEALEGHQNQLLTDIVMLDKMYKANLKYYKELTIYIKAGRKKLEQEQAETLPAMREKASTSGQALDAQAADDFAALCEQFDKKLYDLELTQTISIQTAAQIKMIQNNNVLISEKIQSAINNTIPLWKNQMVLALDRMHSKQAVEVQKKTSNLNDDLLRNTNEQLISALEEVRRIEDEDTQKRREAKREIDRLKSGEMIF